jgi:hypothetical protein
MKFETDAFISYAHLDNVELVEGQKGWVTNLHRALEIRVSQLLGKEPHFWRDPKLKGSDYFADALLERLRRVGALVAVVSPRYIKSEWTRRELTEFCKAAEEEGGGAKARIFKVLKTPVPLEMHPPPLQHMLGYEFFKLDPDTGRTRELHEIFGPEAQRDFWIKLDDLAHDLCHLLETLESLEGALPTARAETEAVFLAETTYDLKEQREAIKRDLQQHGYTVLPARPLPWVVSDLRAAVREDLARCRLSIHLVGKTYGLVPEGCVESLPELQNELAIARGEQGDFSRLMWIPPGLRVEDERQRQVIEQLRTDPRIQKGANLLETSLEDLRSIIQDHLRRAQKPAQEPSGPAPTGQNLTRVYLIYDQRDADAASSWKDFLFNDQGFEVLRPAFEGDEREIREEHEESLRTCDGTLILYGAASECWLRRKLRELQKSAGYGRTKPLPAVAISLLPPKTAEKASFGTHEATVIPQWEGFSPDPLLPFISRLKASEEARRG